MSIFKAQDRVSAVADTNVYRGLPKIDTQAVVTAHSKELWLSPLNVLEILGLRDRDGDNELSRRQAAARKMLELKQGWVVDPECFQASLLGCNVSGYKFDDYEEALNRLIKANTRKDLASVSDFLNVSYAREVRDAAYKQFYDKVKKVKEGYDNWCQDNSVVGSEKFKDEAIEQAFHDQNVVQVIQIAEFDRITFTVQELQKQGTSYCECVLGSPCPSNMEKLLPYVQMYCGYIHQHLKTGKIDKNDFGDMQFVAYCGGNYSILTQESQWIDIAEQVGMGSFVLPFDPNILNRDSAL